MASANSTDKLIIFKGDDTGGVFGRRLAFTIEAGDGVDLSGCSAEWIFDGIVKTFSAPLVNGETREVFYSHNETRCMALGVRYGTFRIIDAAGKVRTLTNTKPVEVTNDAARCYPGASAASFVVHGIGDMKHSEFADLEEKEGMTLKEVGSMVNILIRKLKGTVSAFVALLAFVAFDAFADGAITPHTDFGDISPTAKLKAVVEASGAISGIDTNAVDALANSAVVTNALTVATTNRVAFLESSIAAHVANTNNPHAVTAAQVGAVPLVEDYSGNKTAVTIGNRAIGIPVGDHSVANGKNVTASGSYSHAEGDETSASGMYSHAEGYTTTASGDYSHAEGVNTTASGDFSHAEGSHTTASGDYSHAEGDHTTASGHCSHAGGVLSLANDNFSYTWNGDVLLGDNPYPSHGQGTFNINPDGGLDGFWIGEQTLYTILTNKADKADISAENQTFSNAVLAVGLNIDTNSVAVLNEIASTFGGFPIEGTATTVGGLLAALAAAAAWLKKNKVQTLKLEDGSVNASADGGVAKLDNFFTESNSLLNGRLAYSRNETGLKDRAFNTLSFDGTEYNLSTALAAVTPTASGQPRDLLIVATATAATTISFTAGTIKGDKPTIDGSGTWLITLTEYASGVWYCRQIKMEDAA